MKTFTCKACGSFLRVHLGPVPRDGICSGCRFPTTPAPAVAPAAPVAPLRFVDLDPGERRLYRGAARVKMAG